MAIGNRTRTGLTVVAECEKCHCEFVWMNPAKDRMPCIVTGCDGTVVRGLFNGGDAIGTELVELDRSEESSQKVNRYLWGVAAIAVTSSVFAIVTGHQDWAACAGVNWGLLAHRFICRDLFRREGT